MQAVILKCRPGSRFHFGEVAPDADTALNDSSDFCHSDTLFSALINIVQSFDPASTNALVARFESGDVRISSVFHCLKVDLMREMIWFFPVPAHYNMYADAKYQKRFSAIHFISKKVWEEKILPDQWAQKLDEKKLVLLQHRFLVHRSELSTAALTAADQIKLITNTQLPKVTVHQLTQDNSLFQHSTVQIANNGYLLNDKDQPLLPHLRIHFYFLLDCSDDFKDGPLYQTMLTAIQLLPETGLGGDRSTGCGLFEETEIVQDFALNITARSHASLSLTAPDGENELKKTEYYQTILRGGRATRTEAQPLRMVRMMREGALLSPSVKGRLVDIAPPGSTLPFLRNGKAFTVPVAT